MQDLQVDDAYSSDDEEEAEAAAAAAANAALSDAERREKELKDLEELLLDKDQGRRRHATTAT